MKIFFSVGEPSGDLHGANLIREIKRLDGTVEFVGYGGPKMQQAGCQLHEDLTRLAIMWFLRALLNIGTFWRLLRRADKYFDKERPDAVVLIDYPGFNWWIARSAKSRGIPVFYYGTPQMWAWAGWRVKKMQRYVDHVLCKLPFEVDWYEQRGCNATYVGHPYYDEISNRQLDQRFMAEQKKCSQPLITILPGSRTQEVQSNLKSFIAVAKKLSDRRPNIRFAVAAYKPMHANMAKAMLSRVAIQAQVHVGKTPELIESAHSCLACSGSVSLELLCHEKPTVIHYRIGRFAFFAQRFFRKVRFITLVNLLATDDRYTDRAEIYQVNRDREQVPYPEYLTCTDKTDAMVDHLLQWLTDEAEHQRVVTQLRDIKEKYAHPGASVKASTYMISELKDKTNVIVEAA